MIEATTNRIVVGKEEIEIDLTSLPIPSTEGSNRQSTTRPRGCVALWRLPIPMRLGARKPEFTRSAAA